MAKLNPKQQKFAELYVQTGNARQSYIAAGYQPKTEASADSNASILLSNHKVHAYITELRDHARQNAKITIDDLIKKNAEIAFSNLDDVVHVVGGKLELKPEVESLNMFDGVGASRTVSESESEKTDSKGGSASSKSSSETNSFTLKRPDRLKALDQLAKLIGAYDPEKDSSGATIAGSAERILAALAGLRKK